MSEEQRENRLLWGNHLSQSVAAQEDTATQLAKNYALLDVLVETVVGKTPKKEA